MNVYVLGCFDVASLLCNISDIEIHKAVCLHRKVHDIEFSFVAMCD